MPDQAREAACSCKSHIVNRWALLLWLYQAPNWMHAQPDTAGAFMPFYAYIAERVHSAFCLDQLHESQHEIHLM